MVFILDNLDSFTYNIAQSLAKFGAEVLVKRAAETSIEEIQEKNPTHLFFSPGPGRPSDHPFMFDVIQTFSGVVPLLGVCLGMQAINEYYHGTIRRDEIPMHGKTSVIRHDGSTLFRGISPQFEAARYHSLIIDRLSLELKRTAWTADTTVMGIEHRRLPVYGVQFHPESYLTTHGDAMLQNFMRV